MKRTAPRPSALRFLKMSWWARDRHHSVALMCIRVELALAPGATDFVCHGFALFACLHSRYIEDGFYTYYLNIFGLEPGAERECDGL